MSYLLRLATYNFSKHKPHIKPDVSDVFNYMLTDLNIKLKGSEQHPDTPVVDQKPHKQQKSSQNQTQKQHQKPSLQSHFVSQPEVQQSHPTRKRRGQIRLKEIRDQKSFENPEGEIAAAFYLKHKEAEQRLYQQSQDALKQYAKGESNIEKKPIDPRYSYKISELFKLLKRQEEELKDDLDVDRINRDPNYHAAKIREYRYGVEEIQQEGDVEAFWDLVAKYPGSRIGPLPEDDPAAFYKYIKGRTPSSIKQKFRRQTGQVLETEEEGDQVDRDQMDHEQHPGLGRAKLRKTSVTFRDGLAQNRMNQQYLGQSYTRAGGRTTFYVEHQSLPLYPDFQIKDYQSNWQPWILWQKFRFYYQAMHWKQNIERGIEALQTLSIKQKPKSIGSLYTYYKTLPKFLQENQGLKNVYLGLEYKSPEWTISEKQQALNLTAYLCLPLDPASQILIDQHCEIDKYRLTAYEVDRIFNIKPEFTYEIEDFYNELKDEKLRGEKSIEDKKLAPLETPPKMGSYVEAPKLPVDFFDNEDGFWDDYIVERMNSYSPTIKGRNYLRH